MIWRQESTPWIANQTGDSAARSISIGPADGQSNANGRVYMEQEASTMTNKAPARYFADTKSESCRTTANCQRESGQTSRLWRGHGRVSALLHAVLPGTSADMRGRI